MPNPTNYSKITLTPSGYNLAKAKTDNDLLLQSGDNLLLQLGDNFLLESGKVNFQTNYTKTSINPTNYT